MEKVRARIHCFSYFCSQHHLFLLFILPCPWPLFLPLWSERNESCHAVHQRAHDILSSAAATFYKHSQSCFCKIIKTESSQSCRDLTWFRWIMQHSACLLLKIVFLMDKQCILQTRHDGGFVSFAAPWAIVLSLPCPLHIILSGWWRSGRAVQRVLSWSITADELDEPSEEQRETETVTSCCSVAACFKASSSAKIVWVYRSLVVV